MNLNHIEQCFADFAFEQYFADFAFEFLGKIYRCDKETLNFLWGDLKNKGIEKKDIDGKIEFISPDLKELYEKNPKLKDFVKNREIDVKYFEPEKKVDMDNSSMLGNLKKKLFG